MNHGTKKTEVGEDRADIRTNHTLRVNTLVVGAGIAGLAAARAASEAGADLLVVEKSGSVGGLAQSDAISEFVFDRTGHFMHISDPRVERLIVGLGIPLDRISRRAAVLLCGTAVPYPFQYNLWALNAKIRAGALDDLARARSVTSVEPCNFEEALQSAWGCKFVDMFFRPYNEKLWGRALGTLPADCAGNYMVPVDLDKAVRGALAPIDYAGYNTTFFYPSSGRMGDLMDALSSPIHNRIRFHTHLVAIDLPARCCTLSDGSVVHYDSIVWTAPLPHLVRLARVATPDNQQLQHADIRNVRVGFRGEVFCPYHWAYLPDRAVPAHRVVFPTNVNPSTAPAGSASLSLEVGIPINSNGLSLAEAAKLSVQYLADLGMIRVERITLLDEVVLSPAYVVHRAEGRPDFDEARNKLRKLSIHLAGRYGCWEYYSMQESFLSGLSAARAATAGLPVKEETTRNAASGWLE